MRKVFASLALAALCAVALPATLVSAQRTGLNPSQRAADAAASDPTDDRYIVKFRAQQGRGAADVRAAGGQVVRELPELSAVAARLPERALRALQNNPNVEYVEADQRRYPMQTNPPWSDAATSGAEIKPYGIQMTQADQLSDASAGSRKVCIIDSGYYLGHEDLPSSSTNVTGDSDSGAGNWYQDGSGHGTHVAGTIAAVGGNGLGVVGVLPNNAVKLHIVRVFGDDGTWAYSSDLAAAVGKCRNAGSNVISMSLGGSFSSTTERNAFDSAYSAGVLSIAAAGNAGNTATSYPAGYGSVVSVAAVDANETVADFSQKNSDVEIAAPGVSVLSTVPSKETNTLTVGTTTYRGNHVEFAARSEGASGEKADGGLCDATNSAWSGRVVLCQRGTVSFYDKVRNVQSSGGVAAVIYNNVSGGFFGTLGSGNTSTIPAISLSQEDGQAALAQAETAGTVVSKVEKPASGYDYFNGTSMATPHVSAVAALVWSHNTAWTNQQIRDALNATARDKGTAGRDTSYGYGIVQAKAALDYLNTPQTGPAAPSNLRVTATRSNSITIAWADNSTNETGFRVERCAGSNCSNFAEIGTVGANVTSATNSGLARRTTYTYRVRAYNSSGNSGYSNTASGTTK
jgi:serine protease